MYSKSEIYFQIENDFISVNAVYIYTSKLLIEFTINNYLPVQWLIVDSALLRQYSYLISHPNLRWFQFSLLGMDFITISVDLWQNCKLHSVPVSIVLINIMSFMKGCRCKIFIYTSTVKLGYNEFLGTNGFTGSSLHP